MTKLKSFIGILCLAVIVLNCRVLAQDSHSAETPVKVLRSPGEFEKQEAVWLIWPPTEKYLEGYSNSRVVLDIISAVLPETRVKVAVANEELESLARSKLPQEALQKGLVEFIRIPSVDLWIRDMGPAFVVTTNNGLAVVDFNFNTWGYSDGTDEENAIEERFDELVAAKLRLPLLSTPMISEPGDHESNGKGCLLLVESVELGRNASMNKAQIEAEFKKLLGVKKIIWLEQGLKEDEHAFLGPIEVGPGQVAYTALTTNGHIDEFARFVDESTILLADVDDSDLHDPVAQENKRRLDRAFRVLNNATDQDGKPFQILRIPLPKTTVRTMRPGNAVYEILATLEHKTPFPAGKPISVIAAASYCNFLITNGKVIGRNSGRKGFLTL